MALSVQERKAALVRNGSSTGKIARQLQVTRQHVYLVLVGERRSERVETAIAEAMELPVEEVFGPTEPVAA